MKKIILSLAVASSLFVANSFADLSDGLVAHYEFEGDANDSSGNGNNGTAYNGVTYVDGVIGKAGSFDGINSYIEIISNNFNFTNEMALSLWIKPSDNQVAYAGLIDKSHSTSEGGTTSWVLQQANLNLNQYYFGYRNGNDEWSNEYGIINNASTQTNLWNHLLVIKTNGIVSYFINGNLVSQESNINSTIITNNLALWIGGVNGFNRYYNGLIDELRIYNRALSETEIKELAKLGGIDTSEVNCPKQITYAKNPTTENWAIFSSLCEVPNNWETNTTQPTDFNATAIGLPPQTPIDENTTAIFSAGFKAGKEYVLNNLSEFNTTISTIKGDDITHLSTGWHLMGTTNPINDLSLFDTASVVWKWNNNQWYAYSPDSATQALIESTTNIGTLDSINEDEGFWIKK